MIVYEIGTGYTPIPAAIGAATEIVVEELAKAFLRRNVPVDIVDIGACNRAENTFAIHEVRVPKVFTGTDVRLGWMHKLKRVAYSIALSRELKKILKNTGEKVVFHFHNQYNLFLFLKLVPESLRRRCKTVYTNHSGIWRLPWREIEGTVRRRYFQEAECMKRADVLFVLNRETKENVVTHLGVPEERIRVIHNGVNGDTYHPLGEVQKGNILEKWNLLNRKVILQVGSVCENKGQLRSLMGLADLLRKEPDMVFAYVGGTVSEEYQRQIMEFANENGLESQVRYLGMVSPGEKMNELYNMALASVCASRYEGFSLAVVESLASGTPVLMEEDAPFYAGPGCVPYQKGYLADAVREKLLTEDEDYRQLCEAARRTAVETYSWEQIAAEYLKAF